MGDELILVDLVKELIPYKNTLVLDLENQVSKLAGIYGTSEDFYWMIYNKAGKCIKETCVGSFIPLKGFIKDEDYKKLLTEWNFNFPNNLAI